MCNVRRAALSMTLAVAGVLTSFADVKAQHLAGKVVRIDGTSPIEGVKVTLLRSADEVKIKSATTTEDGNFLITYDPAELPDGKKTVTVVATKDGWKTRTLTGLSGLSQNMPLPEDPDSAVGSGKKISGMTQLLFIILEK